MSINKIKLGSFLKLILYRMQKIWWLNKPFFFFSVVQKPNSGLGRLIVEDSRSHTIRQTHTHTHTHTHTSGRTPLNEWSAHRRGGYLHNTQQTQQTNIHALSAIRTRDTSCQVVTHWYSRRHGLLDRRIKPIGAINERFLSTKIKEILFTYQYCLNNNLLVSAQEGRHHAIQGNS